jgi:hypothetical protein
MNFKDKTTTNIYGCTYLFLSRNKLQPKREISNETSYRFVLKEKLKECDGLTITFPSKLPSHFRSKRAAQAF